MVVPTWEERQRRLEQATLARERFEGELDLLIPNDPDVNHTDAKVRLFQAFLSLLRAGMTVEQIEEIGLCKGEEQ